MLRRWLAILVVLFVMSPVAQAADPQFQAFLQTLWPEAQRHGRLAPDLRRRDPRARAGPVAARSCAHRTAGAAAAAAAGIRADARRLRARKLDRPPRRRRQEALHRASRHARRHRAAVRRAAADHSRHLGPRDGVRRLQAAARCAAGARDPGLHRAAQGHVPRRIPRRAEDAAGRRAARADAQLLGRRDGADPVPAVGILQARGRLRRRRPRRYLDLGARCAGVGGKAACQQGLGARRALGLRGPQSGECRLHHRPAGARDAGRRMAQARLRRRPTAAGSRTASSGTRRRCCCRRAPTVRRF